MPMPPWLNKAATQTGPSPTTTPAKNPTAGGIHFVTPEIAVSGRITKQDSNMLTSQGITGILNCSLKPDPNWSFQDIQVGTKDDHQPKGVDWFGPGIKAAQEMLKNGKILIHCEMGVSRSPSMAYAVLRSQGMSAVQAEFAVKRHVPGAQLTYKDDAEAALQQLGMA